MRLFLLQTYFFLATYRKAQTEGIYQSRKQHTKFFFLPFCTTSMMYQKYIKIYQNFFSAKGIYKNDHNDNRKATAPPIFNREQKIKKFYLFFFFLYFSYAHIKTRIHEDTPKNKKIYGSYPCSVVCTKCMFYSCDISCVCKCVCLRLVWVIFFLSWFILAKTFRELSWAFFLLSWVILGWKESAESSKVSALAGWTHNGGARTYTLTQQASIMISLMWEKRGKILAFLLASFLPAWIFYSQKNIRREHVVSCIFLGAQFLSKKERNCVTIFTGAVLIVAVVVVAQEKKVKT